MGHASQESPTPSTSVSFCVAFATVGQLSWSPVLGALNPVPAQIPSLSMSFWASPGLESQAAARESPSTLLWLVFPVEVQLSHASPIGSLSELVWFVFAMVGQLSFCPVLGALKPVPAQIPSLSMSFWASP